MEALSLLSAIPPLVEGLKGTAELLQACASNSSIVKTTTGLDDQLILLLEVICSIDGRLKARELPTNGLSQLGTALKELHAEVTSLNQLLLHAKNANSPFRRVKLAACGFEKQVKTHVQRVEHIKTLLTLKLADNIDAALSSMSVRKCSICPSDTVEGNAKAARASLRRRIKHVLQPITCGFIPLQLAGTCDGAWSHPAFVKLKADSISEPEAQVICVYGVEGCGKPVLAPSIAADLKDRNMPAEPPRFLFGMVLKASARLPILVVLLFVAFYTRFDKDQEAKQLCAIAIRRADGMNSFEEVVAKAFMGFIFEEEDNLVMAANCHREAVHIVRSLPRKLRNDFVMQYVVALLSSIIFRLGHTDEALELCQQQVEHWTTSNVTLKGQSIWERYVHGTDLWLRHQQEILAELAKDCSRAGFLEEALSVSKRGTRYLQQFHGAHRKWPIKMDISEVQIYLKLGRRSEAAELLRTVIAKNLSGPKKDVDTDDQCGLGSALIELGKYGEAESLFRELRTRDLDPSYQRCITHNLALIHCRRAELEDARRKISKIDFIGEADEWDDKEFPRMFQLSYRVNWGMYAQTHEPSQSIHSWLSERLTEERWQSGRIQPKNLRLIAETLEKLGHQEDASYVWAEISSHERPVRTTR